MRQADVKIAGLRGSIAISETRPPITAGPIQRAFRFLKRISVNWTGVAAGDGCAFAVGAGETCGTVGETDGAGAGEPALVG